MADVANNGGDRINKKIQQMLGRFVAAYPGSEGLVKEEVARMSASRSGERKSGSEGGSPSKIKEGKKKPEIQEDELYSE